MKLDTMAPAEAFKCAYAVLVTLERLAKATESLIVETRLLAESINATTAALREEMMVWETRVTNFETLANQVATQVPALPTEVFKCAYAVLISLRRLAKATEGLIVETKSAEEVKQ